MTTHFIQSNKFYILSGPSASGKSSLTRQLLEQHLPSDAIVSTDTIRKQILGYSLSLDEYGVKERLHGWELNQPDIFHIIEQILVLRFKQKLPTILDATNLNDTERKPYVLLAKKYGIESHIVIFDIPKEELKKRLAHRRERFNFDVVERQLEIFSLTSEYPFSLIEPDDKFILSPNLLANDNIDVVGDTHGLLSETILLLAKTGWNFNKNLLLFSHPDPTRQVFFLGDAVDRGTESIELIKVIKNTVKNGQGLFVLGNHEAKLMGSYEQYKEEGIVRGKSLSSSQTVLKFLALPQEEQEDIYQFLLSTPAHRSLWINKKTGQVMTQPLLGLDNQDVLKLAFAHANNDYYNPYNFTRSHALYGSRSLYKEGDTDYLYERNYLEGLNEYIYFRGHTLNHSKQNHIYSLEADQAFKGYLVSLNLKKYIQDVCNNNWESTHQLFEDNIVKQKSEFDFDEQNKKKIDFMRGMDTLVKNGLATDGWRKGEDNKKKPNPDGIKVYKYSKSVFFDRLWQTEPLLIKARGIGLDIAGNIVIHPFDKIYNYEEYDTGLDVEPERKVQMIDKLNGFLGCISPHPFRNELLFSTTGSLDSPFVQYIKDFVDEKTTHTLLEYFKHNKQTLMFEVIHKDDEHIIQYEEKDHGLWLIGARGLDLTDKILSEPELDALGDKLNFRRPQWTEVTFQEVLDRLPDASLEGYMVRDAHTNETLMKIKSSYYLTTKFVGRLSQKKINFMYKNPEQFKSTIDEEFYPVVDRVIQTPKEIFEQLNPKDKVTFVRDIVNELRNEVAQHSNISSSNKSKKTI